MKFALYHPWIYLRGGVERLLLETLGRSRHEWTVWSHHYEPDHTFEGFADLDVRELEPRVSVQRSLLPLVGASRSILRTQLPDDGSRALLVSSEGLGDFMLARNQLPAAAYCHTPLKILHDPVTRRALERRGPKEAAALRVLGPSFNAVDRRMWRRYQHVFVNSNETMERCSQARLTPSGLIEVLQPGVDLHTFYDDGADRRPFFLVAGRIMWQKNIELAIDAVRVLAGRGLSVPLVIAGAVDDKSKPYLASLRERAAGLDVEFRVDPVDDELALLYRRCTALIYTPWNEDFGIVPLEAMASGAPVIAVDSGGPRETVLPGRTGWLLPNDAAVFARTLELAVGSPRLLAGMRREARRRAEWFTWERVARRIDDVMERLATDAAPMPITVNGVRAPVLTPVPAQGSAPVQDSVSVRAQDPVPRATGSEPDEPATVAVG